MIRAEGIGTGRCWTQIKASPAYGEQSWAGSDNGFESLIWLKVQIWFVFTPEMCGIAHLRELANLCHQPHVGHGRQALRFGGF